MLNITYHQENANQNHNEASPHTQLNGHYQKKTENKTSPAVHWLGIHLSAQGTQAWPLEEDSTCRGQLRPHATPLMPRRPRAPSVPQEKLPQWEAHAQQLKSSLSSLQLEKAHEYNKAPVQPKKTVSVGQDIEKLAQSW